MAGRPSKTILKATELAGEPIEAYFMGTRTHPMAAFAPTFVLALGVGLNSWPLQLAATVLLIATLFFVFGRSVAVTDGDYVVMQGRPPLWRPNRLIRREPRRVLEVNEGRLYLKVGLDGENIWVNKAFTDQVQTVTDTPLKGAKTEPASADRSAASEDRSTGPVRERQRITKSRRITPKGTPSRHYRKKK